MGRRGKRRYVGKEELQVECCIVLEGCFGRVGKGGVGDGIRDEG